MKMSPTNNTQRNTRLNQAENRLSKLLKIKFKAFNSFDFQNLFKTQVLQL